MKNNILKIAVSFLLCMVILTHSGCITEITEKPETDELTSKSDNIIDITNEKTPEVKKSSGELGLLECRFYNNREFDISTEQAENYETDGEILCGIVPHHLLAGEMIASFFETAAKSRPDIETVIITAPAHIPEKNKTYTTLSDWATPFGTLKNAVDFSKSFVSMSGAVINDEMLQADHSASGLIPYIKRYFPNAEVSCLLIAGTASSGISEQTAKLLAEFAEKKNCLFIFSVDFSHYLDPDETEKKDMETREAVISENTELIKDMNDDNMDSPNCVNTFIKLTQFLGGNIKELDHSNSLEISKKRNSYMIMEEGLTSYFIFAGIKNGGVDNQPETPEYNKVSVCAAGDNLIHSPIYIQAQSGKRAEGMVNGYNFSPAYENAADIISASDLAMINQETLICNDIYAPSNYPNFNSPKALGDFMIEMGFDVFSIANNHTLDQGVEGLSACLDYWNTKNAVVAGAYKNSADRADIRVSEVNGVVFSYLSYTEHLNGYSLPSDTLLEIGDAKNIEVMVDEIKKAKKISDICVVFLHWGIENSNLITDGERRTAQTLVDAGADIILGTHPHVLKDIEFIERKDGSKALCAYSLGNFISAQNIPQTMIGGILKFDILNNTETGKNIIENVEFIPTITHYEYNYTNVRIFKLSDYSQTLAAAHGVREYGEFSLNYIYEILERTINKNFYTKISN